MKKKTNSEKLSDELAGIALDTVQDVRSNKNLIPITLFALCVIGIIFFFTSIFPLIKEANSIGQHIGSGFGQIAGTAVGSFEGATQGIKEGYEEGKEDGLSAKDTVATIANTIETNVSDLGRLEVLVANVDLTTYHEVGKTYEALYLTRGSAVFTINLSEVIVTYKEGLISIVLPKPEAVIRIDPEETERLAVWQKKFFNGTDSTGYKAALSTIEAINTISETAVANYSVLQELASASAKKQVEGIANAARGNTDITVTVSFNQTEGGYENE